MEDSKADKIITKYENFIFDFNSEDSPDELTSEQLKKNEGRIVGMFKYLDYIEDSATHQIVPEILWNDKELKVLESVCDYVIDKDYTNAFAMRLVDMNERLAAIINAVFSLHPDEDFGRFKCTYNMLYPIKSKLSHCINLKSDLSESFSNERYKSVLESYPQGIIDLFKGNLAIVQEFYSKSKGKTGAKISQLYGDFFRRQLTNKHMDKKTAHAILKDAGFNVQNSYAGFSSALKRYLDVFDSRDKKVEFK